MDVDTLLPIEMPKKGRTKKENSVLKSILLPIQAFRLFLSFWLFSQPFSLI
jgi:hypothetical protein